jgi:C-5 cytosine-specific DNA methylase
MALSRPLAIDMFCGLSGWGEGLAAEGFEVIGFDIENMFEALSMPMPSNFHLVIQDVLTLHGSQFRDATLIVASPPCQAYSWMAMPWSRAKAKAAAIRADETGAEMEKLNRLFNACFRIQREACAAAGRHVPMVVENVKGAIPWVGRSRWNFGSYHLWGDVPALMPRAVKATKVPGLADGKFPPGGLAQGFIDGRKNPGFRFDGSGRSFQSESVNRAEGFKTAGMNWSDRSKRGQDFTRVAGMQAEGLDANLCQLPSSSPRRKAASAMIAKIPEPLARHIARTFLPGGYGVGSSAA